MDENFQVKNIFFIFHYISFKNNRLSSKLLLLAKNQTYNKKKIVLIDQILVNMIKMNNFIYGSKTAYKYQKFVNKDCMGLKHQVNGPMKKIKNKNIRNLLLNKQLS